MNEDTPPPVGSPEFHAALDRAVALGVRDALRRHKSRGESIVAWENGRVVTIPPAEIVIPELNDEPEGGCDGAEK